MVPTPTVPGPLDIRQTSPSDFPVFAAPNTAPTPCCPPNEVVIALSTSILIPDYSRFYQTPIQDFRGPTYAALGDGSLVTAALMHDIFSANIMLSLLVLLTTIFLRNTFVSGSYLRRTKVRRKVLFYMLFVSQVVACIGTIPQIFSFFKGNLDCSILIYTTNIAASISLSILMTGILGYKAYKCLENSMIVYGILVLFLIGSSVAMILDITHIQGIQRISGSCSRSGDLLFVRVYLIVQFAQSLFLSCCFLYAVWKSHGSPTVRGRISITLSMDGDLDVTDLQRFGRRGWLDYDPAKEQKLCVIISKSPKSRIRQYSSYDIFSRLRAFLFRRPLMAPSRPQSSMGEHLLADGIIKEAQETHRCVSPVVSSHSRISQFIPNMQLFRQVIKDELCYTALITTTYVIFAVLSVIGSNFGNDIPVIGWIGLSCELFLAPSFHD
ncbi:hypothetical protein VNI00_001461 [Paramarasmius palmivorus]|uniref:Uncharacterized protein n=1 Tax=Paramarasmius palmivorus TaxID=297713 RepID=A0AAW0E4E1_9AGAR